MLSQVISVIMLLNIIAIFVMVFLERKEPVYIFAWTLGMVFIPVVGFVLYLFLGTGPKFRKRKSFLNKKKWDELYKLFLYEKKKQVKAEEEKSANFESLVKFNLLANNSLLTYKNDIKIYTDGAEKYKDLLEDLQRATKSIHMLYYIFRSEGIGKQVIDILEQKAKEGVEVRLVYDDVGSHHTKEKAFATLKKNGGQVYKFFPSKFSIIGWNTNYRNHRKIVVIDGEIGYLGGMNIGDEYMGKDKKLTPWRDTHMRLVGESVLMLQIRYLLDYSYAADNDDYIYSLDENHVLFSERPNAHLGEIKMQIVSSGPDVGGEKLKNSFIKLIYSAKTSIDIQTPYFVPDNAFLEAIKTAALSNVKVRIMIPNIPDSHIVGRVTQSYIRELIEAGVEVYLYRGFIHAKTITVDNEMATIGTANLDIRSFKLNFEVNAFIYNEGIAQQMTKIYGNDLQHCRKATLEEEKQKKWYVKFEEGLFRLLSAVM